MLAKILKAVMTYFCCYCFYFKEVKKICRKKGAMKVILSNASWKSIILSSLNLALLFITSN